MANNDKAAEPGLNEKKPRIPRTFDNILKGAMALTLKEKVDLRNALNTDIQAEVDKATEAAKQAQQIAGG